MSYSQDKLRVGGDQAGEATKMIEYQHNSHGENQRCMLEL